MPRVTITEPGANPQPYRFDLEREVVKIGRHSENDIVLTCGSCSSYHAEMRRIPGGYELADLGSTNGISLDGRDMDVVPLIDGATPKLGDTDFGFTLTDEEQATLAAEAPAKPASSAGKKLATVKRAAPAAAAAPATAASAPGSYTPPTYTPSTGGGGNFLVFLLLTIFSVLIGLTIRHYEETGRFILKDIGKTTSAEEAPEAVSAPE